MFDVIWDPIQRAQNSLCRPLMLNAIFLFSLTYSYKQGKQMDVLDYPLNFNVFHCIVKFLFFNFLFYIYIYIFFIEE